MVAVTGTEIAQLAFPLLMLALTRSPAQAGFVGALRALPYLLFSLPAGAFIDRWDRKRVMIVCDTGRALSLASIPLALALGHLTVIQIYLVSLLEGTLFVFFNIAEIACLPNVVLKEQLPAANAQNSVTTSLSFLLGPSLGGVLFAISRALPFLVNAISYTVSVLSLFWIKTSFQVERNPPTRKLWTEIVEGLTWLWKQPLIRSMALLTGGGNVLISGFILLLIVLAQHHHASSTTIGVIFAIGGIGGVIGAVIAPSIQRRFRFGQIILGTFWIWSVLVPFYAFAPNIVVIGVITALFYLLGPIYDVVQVSYRLALIPDELQGRVNSVFRLIAFGGQPLGLAVTGILLQRTDVLPTILIFTGGFMLLAVTATLNPAVREARPLCEG
jgi:MFS family permease